jgi:hypothetical protein
MDIVTNSNRKFLLENCSLSKISENVSGEKAKLFTPGGLSKIFDSVSRTLSNVLIQERNSELEKDGRFLLKEASLSIGWLIELAYDKDENIKNTAHKCLSTLGAISECYIKTKNEYLKENFISYINDFTNLRKNNDKNSLKVLENCIIIDTVAGYDRIVENEIAPSGMVKILSRLDNSQSNQV